MTTASTKSEADSDISLGFDDDNDAFNNVVVNSDQTPMTATSPKSGRQYITSFTTTTTVRPDLSRGVEIIRSLVEQARSTPPVPTGSVQSLTTLKAMPASKENGNQHSESRPITTTTAKASTSTRSTTSTSMPANHRVEPMSTTTRRMPANHHQTHDELIKSFTARPSTTTTKPRQKSRDSVDLPIDINDIQDLLSKVPITTPKVSVRQTTNRPVRILAIVPQGQADKFL